MRKPHFFALLLAVFSSGLLVLSLLFTGGSSAAPLVDGDLDPSFGTGGKVVTDIRNNSRDTIQDIALLSNGQVLVGGIGYTNTVEFNILAKYTTNGSLDTTFGTGGIVVSEIVTDNLLLNGIAVDQQDRIVVGGSSINFPYDWKVLRYNTNGELDTTFGINGMVITDLGGNTDIVRDVIIAPDGKILVAGDGEGGGTSGSDFAVARYNADGSLDTSFGGDGKVTTDIGWFNGSNGDYGQLLVLQPDNKIVVAGVNSAFDYVLVRYNPDGSLDTAFGTNGIVITDFNGSQDEPRDIAIDPATGRIIVVGFATVDLATTFAMAVYQANGTLDNGFSGTGIKTITFPGGGSGASGVVVQPDSKLVVLGGATAGWVLLRFDSAGNLDPSFGDNGQIITTFGPGANTSAALVATADSKLIAGGGTVIAQRDFALARYQNSVSAIPTSIANPSPTSTSTPMPTPTIGPVCLFSDVCPGDYWLEPVRQLVALGAISGYADNTFRPFNNTTRSQLAKIVVVAEGLAVETPSSPTFSDVSSDNPFFGFIETAAARSIVSGYSDGTFKPFNNVTRGQLAKIIVVAEGWSITAPGTPTFSDVDQSNPFYGVIETAYGHGIISGYDVNGGKEFRWGNNATRAQIAKIVALAVSSTK